MLFPKCFMHNLVSSGGPSARCALPVSRGVSYPQLTCSPFVFWVDLSTQNAYVRPLHRCLVDADIKYQKPHIALS